MMTTRCLPLLFAALGAAACSSPSNGASSAAKPARAAVPKVSLAKAGVKSLPGSLHPFARPQRDVGRMDPTFAI
jgi:hypothetical protein